MPVKCPRCGAALEPGDVKCPACSAELPEPTDPSPPQKAAVLAAAMLPLVFLIVILLFVGGIIFAGAKIYRILNKPPTNPVALALPPPQIQPPPNARAPAPSAIPKPIVKAPPPPLPAMPAAAPAPPMTASVPPADVPLPPPPLLDSFAPQVAPQGTPLDLRGQGLTAVDHVQFISTRGAGSVDAKFLHLTDKELMVTVPKVSFENDDMCIVISSPGGMVVMIDQHTGATPWGTDGHLKNTAVIVKEGDEIDTHDNMVLIAREGSAFSVGDNSIAFVEQNVTVKGHGKNCHIYYVGRIELAPGVSREGMTEIGSLQVSDGQDAFRVKPAPPNVDQ